MSDAPLVEYNVPEVLGFLFSYRFHFHSISIHSLVVRMIVQGYERVRGRQSMFGKVFADLLKFRYRKLLVSVELATVPVNKLAYCDWSTKTEMLSVKHIKE